MGCASSKVLGSELAAEKASMAVSRGISMPTHHQHSVDDFHIVALTSSTYGILKVDPPKPPEEEANNSLNPHSVEEVLSKLNNLESKAEAGPQSWQEVSSMLENLKPGLDNNTKSTNNTKKAGQLSKPNQPDAIDINEIMRDLDDDTGLIKAKVAPSALFGKASLKKAGKPFDKSMPIHTLEELDKRIGGKENNVKKGSLTGANPKALPNGVINGSGKATTDGSSKAATKDMPKGDDQKVILAPRNGVISQDSALFDIDFLGSYKKALTNLSEDDWKAVEAHEEAESEQQQSPKAEEEAAQECPEAEAKEGKQAQLASPKSELTGSKQARVYEAAKSEERPLKQQGQVLPKPTVCTKTAAAKPCPLETFEKICPPGGEHSVVIYTTSLRGIRKTYEDCNKVKGIVQSFGVAIDERDVSMHLEYRNELRELMQRVVTVPRLFIKGRYIGGVEEISKLLEEGKLADLFEGAPIDHSTGKACDGCGGARFVPCFECNGSCKVVNEGKEVVRCPDCNENGLMQCPICS